MFNNPYLVEGMSNLSSGMLDYNSRLLRDEAQMRSNNLARLQEQDQVRQLVNKNADELIFKSDGELNHQTIVSGLEDRFKDEHGEINPLVQSEIQNLAARYTENDAVTNRRQELDSQAMSDVFRRAKDLPANMRGNFIAASGKRGSKEWAKSLNDQYLINTENEYLNNPQTVQLVNTGMLSGQTQEELYDTLNERYQAMTGNKERKLDADMYSSLVNTNIGIMRQQEQEKLRNQSAKIRSANQKIFDDKLYKQSKNSSAFSSQLPKDSWTSSVVQNMLTTRLYNNAEIPKLIQAARENADDLNEMPADEVINFLEKSTGIQSQDRQKFLSAQEEDYNKKHMPFDVVETFGNPTDDGYESQGSKLETKLDQRLENIQFATKAASKSDSPLQPKSANDVAAESFREIEIMKQIAEDELELLQRARSNPTYGTFTKEGRKTVEAEIEGLKSFLKTLPQKRMNVKQHFNNPRKIHTAGQDLVTRDLPSEPTIFDLYGPQSS